MPPILVPFDLNRRSTYPTSRSNTSGTSSSPSELMVASGGRLTPGSPANTISMSTDNCPAFLVNSDLSLLVEKPRFSAKWWISYLINPHPRRSINLTQHCSPRQNTHWGLKLVWQCFPRWIQRKVKPPKRSFWQCFPRWIQRRGKPPKRSFLPHEVRLNMPLLLRFLSA